MRFSTALFTAIACLLPVSVMADHHLKGEGDHKGMDHDVPTEAVAKLIPTVGERANGTIVLKQNGDMVHVTGEVWNLSPGEHGFHIHQWGDLRSTDGKSAGGHYNPDGHDHAGPDTDKHHAGDLGNITAGPDGRAMVDMKVKGLKLHFVIGRSIVVHGGRDDLTSQPSGNAGPRVALGVIGFAEVKEKMMDKTKMDKEKAKQDNNKKADKAKNDKAKNDNDKSRNDKKSADDASQTDAPPKPADKPSGN